jgi:hypothetical protein
LITISRDRSPSNGDAGQEGLRREVTDIRTMIFQHNAPLLSDGSTEGRHRVFSRVRDGTYVILYPPLSIERSDRYNNAPYIVKEEFIPVAHVSFKELNLGCGQHGTNRHIKLCDRPLVGVKHDRAPSR